MARVSDDLAEHEHRVVIENQFGRTNHVHLGQILTYLAGIEHAKTVVWIAETFQADHRAAVDWLNTNTSEDFSFFAIEIELWRIGDSAPAPRFNIIASPNDWAKSARRASAGVGEQELAERHRLRLTYWTSFDEFLQRRSSSFRIRRSRLNNTVWFPIGRAGTVISAIISTEKRRIGVALYTDRHAFRALLLQRHAIEADVGEPLDWQELSGQKRSRINLYCSEDPSDGSRRQEQHSWMFDRMERFRSAFVGRVRELPRPEGIAQSTDESGEDS